MVAEALRQAPGVGWGSYCMESQGGWGGDQWRRSPTLGTDERDAGEAMFVGGKLVGWTIGSREKN
jgi:hypothetical protein